MKITLKSLKRKIYFSLEKSSFRVFIPLLEKINKVIFHWKDREKMVHLGNEDCDKTYYIIRPRSCEEGLMSLYFNNALSGIVFAKAKGYIPVISYCDNKCQYWTNKNEVRNKIDNNAWEYYFNQPENVHVSDVYNKRNVIFTGWTLSDKKICRFDFDSFVNGNRDNIKNIVNKYGRVNSFIQSELDSASQCLHIGDKTLGVFIRGTDYIKLKPKGHFKQPCIKDIYLKIDEFLDKYDIEKILLITEDYNIFKEIKLRYGDLILSPDNIFIRKYNGDYLEKSFNDNPYDRGLRYIIRLLLLTKCGYLISSITNGSIFVFAYKDDNYKDSFLFNLGRY